MAKEGNVFTMTDHKTVSEEITEYLEEVDEYLQKERNKEFLWTTLTLKLAKLSGRWRAFKDGISDKLHDEKTISDCEVHRNSVFNITKRVQEELEKEADNEVQQALKKKLLIKVNEWEKAHIALENSPSIQS